jgi:hypothetical protein
MLTKIGENMLLLVRPILVFIGTILLVSTIQWLGVQFLATYCGPYSWLGPIYNLLSLGSPLCHFVNHVQVALADYYVAIWGSTAVALITWFSGKKKDD